MSEHEMGSFLERKLGKSEVCERLNGESLSDCIMFAHPGYFFSLPFSLLATETRMQTTRERPARASLPISQLPVNPSQSLSFDFVEIYVPTFISCSHIGAVLPIGDGSCGKRAGDSGIDGEHHPVRVSSRHVHS